MNGQHCKRQQKSQVIAVGEWQKEEKVDQFLAVLTVSSMLSAHADFFFNAVFDYSSPDEYGPRSEGLPY
ncbi:hypothetical protein BDB00DRAFT_873113 [Zychaea mexicana]|uniref:uncharacterized protein n=1 Tax=Zychaea mexicana TaxID=64656 RepID=UPI0022FE4D6F|nr:uncharacterized protein BDB00DRAFT_873113 [Zychaea mexicana]KAI9492714.1 hypothetical protein BDB00DRAFT_873113 [Zychaea mexicana]